MGASCTPGSRCPCTGRERLPCHIDPASPAKPSVAATFSDEASSEVNSRSPVRPSPRPARLDGSGFPWASPLCSRMLRYLALAGVRDSPGHWLEHDHESRSLKLVQHRVATPPENCACKFPRTQLKPSQTSLAERGDSLFTRKRLASVVERILTPASGQAPDRGSPQDRRLLPGHLWGTSATPHGQKGTRGGRTASATCRKPPSRYAPGADEPCGPGDAPYRG